MKLWNRTALGHVPLPRDIKNAQDDEKKICVCMFAGCIHPVFTPARRRPAAVAKGEGQCAASRLKGWGWGEERVRKPKVIRTREWLPEDRRLPSDCFDEVLERVTPVIEVPLCPTPGL